jgi:hypothetical protein
MAIKHTFVSAVVDQGNPDEVGPDEWNDDHVIEDNSISEAKLTFDPATQAELDAHAAAGNPHPVYTTDAEATTLAAAEVATHAAAGNPHPVYTTDAEATTLAAAEVAAHAAAGDPHTGYRLESADHSHQSTGAQAGTLDAAAIASGALAKARQHTATVYNDAANTYSTGAQDFGAATSLVIPKAAAPTPTADGDVAYGTTQDHYVAGGAGGLTGSFPRVLSVTRPNEQKTNSTTNDQDYTSVFTIPANYLIAQKTLRVSFFFQQVSDGSASTVAHYLKLGSTKVYTANNSATQSNSVTRGMCHQFMIIGTAAAGASANVDTFIVVGSSFGNSAANNATSQPVALATNGALNIVFGIAYGTNTSGESITLLDAIVEELN